MSDNKIAWRSDPDTIDWLTGRAERALAGQTLGLRARIELSMWRQVLAEELRRQRWTLGQLGLIADALNGTMVPDAVATSVGLVAAEVIDATRSAPGQYAAKWGVDEDALTVALSRLSPAGDIALADAVARWWSLGADHSADGWDAVGMTLS